MNTRAPRQRQTPCTSLPRLACSRFVRLLTNPCTAALPSTDGGSFGLPLPGSVHRRRRACRSRRRHRRHPRRRLRRPRQRHGRATGAGGPGRRPGVPGLGLLHGMHAMLLLLLATRTRSPIPRPSQFANIIESVYSTHVSFNISQHMVVGCM